MVLQHSIILICLKQCFFANGQISNVVIDMPATSKIETDFTIQLDFDVDLSSDTGGSYTTKAIINLAESQEVVNSGCRLLIAGGSDCTDIEVTLTNV